MVLSVMPSESSTPRLNWWERTLTVTSRIQPLAVVAAAVGAPVVLTAALLPFRSQVPTATVALGLAVLVSLLAAIGSRVSALIAAVSAALCFDIDRKSVVEGKRVD